jgi:hypothetical protein
MNIPGEMKLSIELLSPLCFDQLHWEQIPQKFKARTLPMVSRVVQVVAVSQILHLQMQIDMNDRGLRAIIGRS